MSETVNKSSFPYNLIGKQVHVKMDRPLGTKHPKFGFVYEVNYGFVPNTVSGDGEELDAYLLGVFEPVKEYTGILRCMYCCCSQNK